MERLTCWLAEGAAGIAPNIEEQYKAEEVIDILALRLAAYEDTGFTPEEISQQRFFIAALKDPEKLARLRDIVLADEAGRLVVLPCKRDTVYTIEENYFSCDECKHKDSSHYNPQIGRVSCDIDGARCPLCIEEHEVGGFEICFDENGAAVLSGPGEFGYEGLELFSGVDGKVHFTREEAEATLREEAGEDG